MMSLPDFREKQILFIRAEKELENRLQFKNDNLTFVKDGKIINQLSCYKIFVVFIIGDFTISTPLIRNCNKYGISIFLLKNNFEVYASMNSESAGNFLLREKQYIKSKQDSLELAKHIVKNKIFNQFALLREVKKIKDGRLNLKSIFAKIDEAKDCNSLLGLEGNISKIFFKKYFSELNWYKRMPRTKVDEINILLDIGYTFLFNFVDSLLLLYGFDTYKGVYHTLFFQRKSLSCDIMEPFRSIIDRQIIKSFNLKQIDLADFKKTKDGSYFLSYDKQNKYLRFFSEAIMEQKEEIFVFVREYYYFIMKDGGVDFPVFKIK